jgi:hypothetical protein
MKIIIANNSASLEAINPDATVEAEYGDMVVLGQVITLAHHGIRSNRPCPCSLPNFPDLGIETIGISHVDLDTIGGILAILGQKPDQFDWVRNFWRVAAEVDARGVHKLHDIGFGDTAPKMIEESLNAWWAFSESPEGRVFAPRDGSAVEVDLTRHFDVLTILLTQRHVPCRGGIDEHEHTVYCGCPDCEGYYTWDSPERLELIEAGRAWADAKAKLDQESLVEDLGVVLLRSSDQFTNHLYRSAKAVVSFNTKFQSVTVSLADPIPGVSCREIVQDLWGPEAGGHDGIAGSPRGQEMTLGDARTVVQELKIRLSGFASACEGKVGWFDGDHPECCGNCRA